MDRLIRADQIDFSESASTAVVTDGLRFILPVPALVGGGEALRHPDGSWFTDPHGGRLHGRGVVFFNHVDRCWQAARGDGSEVIVFSLIDEARTVALKHKIAEFASAPDLLTLDQIKSVIDFACDELRVLGAHSTTRAFVSEAMVPVPPHGGDHFGLYRRKGTDVGRAVYIPGTGAFIGPTPTPQLFSDGAVVLNHRGSIRLLLPVTAFEQTYRLLDGRPALVAHLAVQSPGAAL